MRKLFFVFIFILIGIFIYLIPEAEAVAKKSKGKNSNLSKQTLSVVNNRGEKVLNGSVLNPKEDELFVLLHSILVSTLRGDLNNVSVVLTSITDPSKRFVVPKEAINIQDRKVNKKNGKYLSVSLFNIKTPSGVTIPPSSLKSDNYKLRIVNSKNKLDVSTDSFNYQTPVLIVGMASQKSSGFVVVEDLLGNPLSDDVVSLSAGGSFFTEVRADKVKSLQKSRTAFQSNLKNQTTMDDISAGLVHVVTDKDLYAIIPLDNNPDINNAQTDNPLEVNESTTLTAELAKEDEDLALEVAKKQLEDLESGNNGTENEFGDLDCDINQFVDLCDTEDKASLGEDVKSLISECNLPNFVANIILNSAGSDIGKGYCEFVGREENESKLCSSYSDILNNFKIGKLKQLPCPPSFCTDFQSIKPPKCVSGKEFCDSNSDGQNCISKQTRDLFCLRVPEEISEDECADDPSFDSSTQPNWEVISNSFGGQYCVPSNPVVISQIKTSSSQIFSSPEDVAEECEYNYCHKQCDKGSVSDSSSCHNNCDIQFGRKIDCTDINSPFFSIQCCNSIRNKSRLVTCICANSNNFDDVGYAYEDSKLACSKTSSSGSSFCSQSTPIQCSDGTCAVTRAKCSCPSNTPIKCSDGTCAVAAADCTSTSSSFSSSGSSSCPQSKPIKCSDGTCAVAAANCSETSSSSGGSSTVCAIGQVSTAENPCTCASGATAGHDGTCQCSNGQVYAQAGCPNSGVSSCPSSRPIQCSDGTCAVAAADCTSTSSSFSSSGGSSSSSGGSSTTCNIGQVSTATNPCTCASGATMGSDGTCQCSNGQVYAAAGCPSSGNSSSNSSSSSSSSSSSCPSSTPIQCSNGTCAVAAADCSSSNNFSSITSSGSGSNSCSQSMPVQCSDGTCAVAAADCASTSSSFSNSGSSSSSSSHTTCNIGQVSTATNPCTCASGATMGSDGTCQCSNGQVYAAAGCPQ